jgi:hypothetical protein
MGGDRRFLVKGARRCVRSLNIFSSAVQVKVRAALFLVAAVLLLTASSASAARPGNDNYANARAVELDSFTEGTTAGSTREGRFDPTPSYLSDSVWYKLRTTRAVDVSINTRATKTNLDMSAYTGASAKTAKRVKFRFRLCAHSRTRGVIGRFHAEAGVSYRIGVSTYRRPAGAFDLVVAAVEPYANDAFAGAQAIRVGRAVVASNQLATAEPGEPRHAGRAANHSLWFRFEAPRSETVNAATFGSSFDTVLGVYTGNSLAELRRVASNDDASRRTVASQVAWRAKKGTTYWIAADGVKGGRVTGVGDLVLRLVRGA